MLLTDEQDSLAALARDWFHTRTDLGAARARYDDRSAGDAAAAGDADAARELGIVDLLTAEAGGTHVDLALVAEAAGYAGSPIPVVPMALACWIREHAGWRPGRCGGVLLAEGGAPLVAAPTADGLALRGSVPWFWGAPSGELVAVAAGPDRAACYVALLDGHAATRTPASAFDLSRPWCTLTVDVTVPAGCWIGGQDAARLAAALADAWALHTAADAVGAADRSLALTLTHVRDREQFGRRIGTFQAVKHRCADMALAVEAARATTRAAARALDTATGEQQAAVAVAAAAAFTGAAASRTASSALQLHGGMGFTWEHDLHLFLRRAKADELIAGTPRHHQERLLDLVTG
ncbi:MAG TPA: acyl-CoA dehydrogenase family protein [Mycobacteriales bacterium]|nr:acyl-CoA dehydrogenase family protein [Mycobacteriales bacterium]